MPNIVDPYIAELEYESISTRKLLVATPQDKFTWKPHDKSFSLLQLASHVAHIPVEISAMLLSDGFNFAAQDYQLPMPDSSNALVQAFETGVSEAKQAMLQLDDSKMLENWTLKMGEQEIFTMPRAQVLRTMLFNHWYHHRGQLTVYLRLLDVALPSVYGPSADDNPFAG